MTRTTELLKGCGRGSYPHFCGEKIKGISNSGDLCPECKSELKGRLDALKEEVEFLESLGLVKIKEDENLDFETVYMNDTFYQVDNRIKYLQEEIKLIEEKI